MDTNLKGIFLVGYAVAKKMIAQQIRQNINISSIFGGIGISFQSIVSESTTELFR